MATKKSFNNATLNIRLPEPVLKQFEQIAHGIYKTPSELTRQLIIDYVNNRKDVLTALNQPNQPKPQVNRNPHNLRMSPYDMEPTNNRHLYSQDINDDWV